MTSDHKNCDPNQRMTGDGFRKQSLKGSTRPTAGRYNTCGRNVSSLYGCTTRNEGSEVTSPRYQAAHIISHSPKLLLAASFTPGQADRPIHGSLKVVTNCYRNTRVIIGR